MIATPGLAQPISDELTFDEGIETDQAVSRPDPSGVPTKVSIGLFVLDISKISDADQTVTADFIVILHWNDHRLGDNTKVRTLSLNQCVASIYAGNESV